MCIFKTKSLVLLLVTLLLALFSSGKTQTPPKELSSDEETDSLKSLKIINALDIDKNGKISLKEIESIRKVFKELDKNNDGELSNLEFGFPNNTLKSSSKPSRSNLSARPARRPTVKPYTRGTGSSEGRDISKAGSAKKPSLQRKRVARTSSARKSSGISSRRNLSTAKNPNILKPTKPLIRRPSNSVNSKSNVKSNLTETRRPSKPVNSKSNVKSNLTETDIIDSTIDKLIALKMKIENSEKKVSSARDKRILERWVTSIHQRHVDSLEAAKKRKNSDIIRESVKKVESDILKVEKIIN